MLFVLSLHIVFLIIWSACLLYFPQLVVRQAIVEDADHERDAMRMQRTLYALVMTPSALLAVIAGTWLVFDRGFVGGWLAVKLALVMLMTFFHAYCGSLMNDFRHHRIRHRLWFYRVLPLLPLLLITATVALVVAKPF